MRKVLGIIVTILKKAFLWFLGLSIFFVILYRFVPVPVTPLMLIRSAEQKFEGKEMILRKDWVPLEEISPNLQLAVVCSEDQNFLNHNGFDYKAIEKAMEHNEKSKRKWGASTISQQTAKNVFLWPGRSWIRKGLEVYFTFLIELIWSKERIMEVYLNVIEMGSGIYGAQAAGKNFFKVDAKKLSRQQSALIAAVLPNPREYSTKKPSAKVLKKQQRILKQMNNWGNRLDYDKTEVKETAK